MARKDSRAYDHNDKGTRQYYEAAPIIRRAISSE